MYFVEHMRSLTIPHVPSVVFRFVAFVHRIGHTQPIGRACVCVSVCLYVLVGLPLCVCFVAVSVHSIVRLISMHDTNWRLRF